MRPTCSFCARSSHRYVQIPWFYGWKPVCYEHYQDFSDDITDEKVSLIWAR